MHKSTVKNLGFPFILLGALLLPLIGGDWFSSASKSFLYALSLLIKEGFIFCLPFIIFGLVFNAIAHLGAKGIVIILVIVPLICASNLINTVLSYSALKMGEACGLVLPAMPLSTPEHALEPAFLFHIPLLVSNDMGLWLGAGLGVMMGVVRPTIALKWGTVFNVVSQYFFKGLLWVLPFFIFGTALKLQHDGVLVAIFERYLPVLLTFAITVLAWIALQFFLLASGNLTRMGTFLRNVMPAVVTAFSSLSSAAALPLTLKGAEMNCKKASNADIIVPATVNVHLVGDCFFIPMVAIAVLQSFGMPFPSWTAYMPFAIHFVLAKFAVAAVPGGGVLVMLPVMQTYLGLTSDMLALVTSIYFLFDPLITTCNVAGNSAFAIFFDRLNNRIVGDWSS